MESKKIKIPMRVIYPTPAAKRAQNIVEIFDNGAEYRWTQFLPSGMKDGLPLVVEIHGGGGNGDMQCASTAWAELAEKKNFAVIFPTANYEHEDGMKKWRCQREDFAEDAEYIYDIIMRFVRKYNIDTQRIYMSGMSLGDMMSTIFASRYGSILAGLCSINGPTSKHDWKKLKIEEKLPVIQIRGELDVTLPMPGICRLSEDEAYSRKQELFVYNRKIWMEKLKTRKVPEIRADNHINYALYRGDSTDLFYLECKKMGHVEPQYSMHMAWEYCFSKYRRIDGEIVRTESVGEEFVSSESDFIIASGAGKIYTNHGIKQLGKPPLAGVPEPIPEDHWCVVCSDDYVRQEAVYISLDVLSEVIGAKLDENIICVGGKNYQFYRDNCLVSTPEEHLAMEKPALICDDTLWVPAGQALEIFGYNYCETDGVLYCSKKPCYLTRGFAALIRGLFE